MEDLETNKQFLAHIRMCLDLGLDPENPNLEWVEPIDTVLRDKPWLEGWMQREYDSDIDWHFRENLVKRSKKPPQVEVNNVIR